MLLTKRNGNWLPGIFNDLLSDEWVDKAGATAPAMNVIDSDKCYDVELAVPGLTKQDLKIELENDNVLSVSMERKQEKDDKKGRYVRREFSYQSFRQSYILPENIDSKNIVAEVEHGVLKIHVPKQTATNTEQAVKQIEIK